MAGELFALGGRRSGYPDPSRHSSIRCKLMKLYTSRTICPLLLTSLALISGCGAEGFPLDAEGGEPTEEASLDGDSMSIDDSDFGELEQGLATFCSGDDTNMLAAGLAVAIGKELRRWDVNTDFAVVNGK